jgi:hypothetical protein
MGWNVRYCPRCRWRTHDVRMGRRCSLATAIALGATALSGVARADQELWLWSEMRLPVASTEEFPVRTTLRVWNDARFSGRRDGLHQLFLRVGPLFDLTPWLFVGVHGTVYADHLATGQFEEERRAELEPNLYWRWGAFTFSDRNRLEYRWRDSGDGWRYRNQLRINYAPEGQTFIPFVWDEVLVPLFDEGSPQNRLMAGLGVSTTPSTRIEVGYMWRARHEAEEWQHDHIAVLYLFYNGWAR